MGTCGGIAGKKCPAGTYCVYSPSNCTADCLGKCEYDCSNRELWNDAKKEWCCAEKQLGCPTTTEIVIMELELTFSAKQALSLEGLKSDIEDIISNMLKKKIQTKDFTIEVTTEFGNRRRLLDETVKVKISIKTKSSGSVISALNLGTPDFFEKEMSQRGQEVSVKILSQPALVPATTISTTPAAPTSSLTPAPTSLLTSIATTISTTPGLTIFLFQTLLILYK